MVIAKWDQIRLYDKTIVFRFFDGNTEIGSRGIPLTDEDIDKINKLTFGDLINMKINGVTVPDKLSDNLNIIEILAYKAYQEFLNAKKTEEEQKNMVIE